MIEAMMIGGEQTKPIGWDLTLTVTELTVLDISTRSTDAQGIHFKTNGSILYIADSDSGEIVTYNLSTPWDLSTETYLSTEDISGRESDPQGIYFNDDGTMLFVIGKSSGLVTKYILSTAWLVSSLTYDSEYDTNRDTRGIYFSPDGSYMFVMSSGNTTVISYALATAWVISSGVTLDSNFNISTNTSTAQNIFLKTDGTVLYSVNYGGGNIVFYDITTPWDLDGVVTYDDNYAPTTVSTLQGMFFSSDGMNMFTCDSGNNEVSAFKLTATN